MKLWPFAFPLDSSSAEPLFLQLSRVIASDVRRGRLLPGTPLPGSRTLARTLSIHRNTVLAAYGELEAEGWIQAMPRRGVFVSAALPDVKPRPFTREGRQRTQTTKQLPFELPPGPEFREWTPDPKDTLVMGGGIPDVNLVRKELLARAYRRVLLNHAPAVLSYADPRGHEKLRTALAGMLAATRGLAITCDDLLVTRGSQMALALVARSLLQTRDCVAVEGFGYAPAWEAFRAAGADLVSVPVDKEGLCIDELERQLVERPIRAVYVTPHHQYPTTVVMTAPRRLALLALARKHRFMIIEDDYHHEFHYDGRPVLPLASADETGVVTYIGSLSKVLAPGLRLGYLVVPRALLNRASTHRAYIDRQGDQITEAAVAELFEDGEVQRHIRRAKRIYRARRSVLADELKRRFHDAVSFQPPAGGMAIWTKVDRRIDVEAWAERARERGVVFLTARSFSFDRRSRPYIRLGFAGLAENQIREAVKRMAAAL